MAISFTDSSKQGISPGLTQNVHSLDFTTSAGMRPAVMAPYITVPTIRDTATGISTSLIPWVEPQRTQIRSSFRYKFILEYDPNSPNRYVFPRSRNLEAVVILVYPWFPLPPGFFMSREGPPMIVRQEVPYRYTPTAPIPGNLRIRSEYSKIVTQFKHYAPADLCPNYYLSRISTIIISNSPADGVSAESYRTLSWRYLMLLPSETGMQMFMLPR